jgi:hypothetical protein
LKKISFSEEPVPGAFPIEGEITGVEPTYLQGGCYMSCEEGKYQVLVGREAPDFETNAFVDGGFKKIKLSDYRGKWVVLCFYPGDFTFV